MIIPPWPDHLLTLAEWAALPEDNSRYWELQEGVLIGNPRPPAQHQLATMKLACLLHDRLPPGEIAIHQVEVVVREEWPATVRVPDVIVVPEEIPRTNRRGPRPRTCVSRSK